MKLILAILIMMLFCGLAFSATKTNVYVVNDTQSFEIEETDIVRICAPSPGSTGYKTKVSITEGDAKVSERVVSQVTKGSTFGIGNDSPEFDIIPTAGKKGKVKVTVTMTPPAGKDEVKVYEFVVK